MADFGHIAIVAAYGRLLPQPLLDVPPLGFINVHASLLPRWRGAAPIHRAVIAGDTITGVTIIRVVLELDAGLTEDRGREDCTGNLRVAEEGGRDPDGGLYSEPARP